MASTMELLSRGLYSNTPPDHQTKADVNPTLLVSWWATGFAIVIILIRVAGRFVRTEKLFLEDKIMFYSIIPLLIRMGLVHVILIWGTNNTVITGLSRIEIQHREIGSKLVLAARIFYAMFIWIAKYSLMVFLKRTIGKSWHKSYEIAMRGIDAFLALTFIAVVISTLSECHPFPHYFQVVPDPGPHCREALAQLITMGVCDIITDAVLICFPIPLVMQSAMPMKRKINLVLLFLLSIILIAITAYRMPSTVTRKSSQQFRSLLASIEILAASFVANAIVIGSFLRDRGMKKAKFRAGSITDSNALQPTPTRATTRSKSITQHHWGSDEDLVRELGIRLDPSLQHRNNLNGGPQPAPVAPPNSNAPADLLEDEPAVNDHSYGHASVDRNWNFAKSQRQRRSRRRDSDSDLDSTSSTSTDIKLRDLESNSQKEQREIPPSPGEDPLSSRNPKMSFFDVGGLIDNGSGNGHSTSTPPRGSRAPSVIQESPAASRAFISDVGGLLSSHPEQDNTRLRPIMADSIDRHSPALRAVDHKHTSASVAAPSENFSTGGSAYERGSGSGPSMAAPPQMPDAGFDSLNISDAGGLLH